MANPGTLTIVIIAVFSAGYFLAKWRRALSDLRKTIASIPALRKAARTEGGRLTLAAAVIFAVTYVWLHH